MINRFRWFVEECWLRFIYWILGPWKVCWHCTDCQPDSYQGEELFWCDFVEKEVDPDGTCRAFKGWVRR